jgi:two-component system cell cycle sensor histidine kinase/response regulator CckA
MDVTDLDHEREELLLRERRQRQTAETLAAAYLALAQSQDLDAILDTLLDYVGRLVPSDSSMVLLLQPDSTLSVAALRGHEKWAGLAAGRKLRFEPGKSRLLDEILRECKPILVSDTRTDARWTWIPEGEHIRCWLGVPLVIHGKAIGLYSLDKTEPGFFDDEHVGLAVSLAPAAASAVEIARLLRDVREAAEFGAQIIASADEGIVVVDRDHRPRVWNRLMESLSGIPASAVIGKSYLELFPQVIEKGIPQLEERALAGETLHMPDILSTTPDGRASWTSARLSPLRNAAGAITGVIAVVRDITERKTVEETLGRSAARLRAVVDGSLDAVIGMDAKGCVTSWNPRAETIFGWAASEAMGRVVADLIIPPQWRDAHRQGLSRFLATGQPVVMGRRVELTALRRGGMEFPVELSIVASEDSGGVAFTGFVADITERKEAVRRLAEGEERFRQIAENIREVFWITDLAERRLIYVSPAYEAIWGKSCASACEAPTSFAEAIHPEDRARVLDRMSRQASGEYDEVYRILRPDGSLRWIHDQGFPVPGPAGEVLRVVGSAQDITELKQTEQALRDSEGRYRSLFEGAPDGILVADSLGRYVDVNPSALSMLGYSREEVIGMESMDILASAEHSRVAAALRDIKAGIDHRYEWEFRRKDGSEFRADVMATVMADGRILALIRDATERRRMEGQLRQSQKMEAIGSLAGGIAHDFNNILGVILGYGEMLRNKTAASHPDRSKIDQILGAATRAAGLTRQLLAFSRKQVLEPKVLQLSVVVSDMKKLLQPLIGEDIDFVVSADAMGRVKVDPGQLEQVLMNLVVNARDAMPMGGALTIETSDVDLDQEYVRHRGVTVAPGRYVTIAVTDSGVGMDEATQARVFEPFFTTKSEGKGTGLGLATVYGIVKQSGGYIWMYSEVGMGTIFRVYLPRVDEAVVKDPQRTADHIRTPTETVLVVEDEAAALELVGEILRDEGYQVLLARNGQEAVDMATRTSVPLHLLLTDVVLPKLSGRAAADRIRAIHPHIKVLFMSGYTDDQVSRHGVLEPGIALLQKPFTPTDLTRRVGEILEAP